jgi:hypothetical protein
MFSWFLSWLCPKPGENVLIIGLPQSGETLSFSVVIDKLQRLFTGFLSWLWTKPEEDVLIIGLPQSGKTVFFSVVIDKLQRLFNALDDPEGKYRIEYEPPFETTEAPIQYVLDQLRQQKWPPKTLEPKEFHVTITCDKIRRRLICKDYGGEAFERTFSSLDVGAIDENVEGTLTSDVKNAERIALIIDSTMICEKADNKLSNVLSGLLALLQKSNRRKKLALIFAKGDRMPPTEDVKAVFMKQQPNAYARLKGMKEWDAFLVTAVRCDPMSDTEKPPRGFSSEKNSGDIFKPMEWLLDIHMPELKKR